MPTPDVLVTFFLASCVLGAAPGPDNIFVLTQSALDGVRAGFVVVLGLCTGLLFHTAAVALGVAALLAASLLAFTVLKLVGAAYLLYLAYGVFRAGAETVLTGEITPVVIGIEGAYFKFVRHLNEIKLQQVLINIILGCGDGLMVFVEQIRDVVGMKGDRLVIMFLCYAVI